MSNEENKNLRILETIKTTSFLAFIISFLIFMWFSKVNEIQMLKVHITVWIAAWTAMLMFGFSKGSVVGFAMGLVKILTSKDLTSDQKVAMLLNVIQEALDITAYLSILANKEEKKEDDTFPDELPVD